MSFIKVKNLNFEYTKKEVLKNISFEIKEGSVTALVGPNGAGKTTLLRCLTSLESPMSGHVFIDGIDVHDHPRDAQKSMGYLSDFFGVYDNLTVRQSLTYMAWCQKIPNKNLKQYIEELAEEVDITDYLEHKAGLLSRGYKQRLGVGLALVHNPKCIFLDEPASGMDPEARIKFSELMISLRKRGVTIMVSSHILAELEDYCTDMLIIRDGEIKSHVLLSEHQKNEQRTLHIAIQSPTEKHIGFIRSYEGVSELRHCEEHIAVSFIGGNDKQAALLKAMIAKKIPVYQFTPTQKTLKTAYMDLVEKKEVNKT